MMQKLQRFGAAMFTPVLLFTFAGIMTAICILMTNEQIFGSMAAPGTNWYGVWQTLQAGAFTVFNIIHYCLLLVCPLVWQSSLRDERQWKRSLSMLLGTT